MFWWTLTNFWLFIFPAALIALLANDVDNIASLYNFIPHFLKALIVSGTKPL